MNKMLLPFGMACLVDANIRSGMDPATESLEKSTSVISRRYVTSHGCQANLGDTSIEITDPRRVIMYLFIRVFLTFLGCQLSKCSAFHVNTK